MSHKKSEFLKCDCPDKGKFQGAYIFYSNQHGRKERHFCPYCTHFVDVQWMKRNDYQPEIVREWEYK